MPALLLALLKEQMFLRGCSASLEQSWAPREHEAEAVGLPSPLAWPHTPRLALVLTLSCRCQCEQERCSGLPALCSLGTSPMGVTPGHTELPLSAHVSLTIPGTRLGPPRTVPARLHGAAGAGLASC